MPTFTICRGIPGSGKSTWAAKQGQLVVNRDTLRLQNPGRGEAFIRNLRDKLIEDALRAGKDVISDDTNLIPKTFDALVKLGTDCGATIKIQDFTDISVDECIRRDAGRANPVGEKVVRSFVQFLNIPKRQPQMNYVENLPAAILCDLDGTLALFTNRGPFDTAKCEDDALSIPVYQTMQAMRTMYLQEGKELHIILMSGREDKFRPHTERWLQKHKVYADHLYMRKAGDFRKDAIVKRELFDAHVKGKYNVLFVLDDRDQVVRMWRHDLNLVVFQVAEGNF